MTTSDTDKWRSAMAQRQREVWRVLRELLPSEYAVSINTNGIPHSVGKAEIRVSFVVGFDCMPDIEDEAVRAMGTAAREALDNAIREWKVRNG